MTLKIPCMGFAGYGWQPEKKREPVIQARLSFCRQTRSIRNGLTVRRKAKKRVCHSGGHPVRCNASAPLVSGFNKARRLLTNRVSADFSRVAFAHLLRTFCPFNVQEAKLQDKLPAANVSGG